MALATSPRARFDNCMRWGRLGCPTGDPASPCMQKATAACFAYAATPAGTASRVAVRGLSGEVGLSFQALWPTVKPYALGVGAGLAVGYVLFRGKRR